jgi:hypothetical protein
MKKHTLLFTILSVAACSGDTTNTGDDKVVVEDPAEVLDPDGDGAAEGSVDGMVAAVSFELAEPLPEIPFRVAATDDAAMLDVIDALSLVVSSPRSGVSVSLAEGTLVAGTPMAAGQWSVELAEDRMSFELSWYNGTTSGLTMKAGEDYDVMYSLGDNCCVDAFGDTAMKFRLDAGL